MTAHACPPPSAPPSTLPSSQDLGDEDLATWLDRCRTARHPVGYLHSQYVCKVFNLTDSSATLHPSDPETKSKAALRKLAKRGLLQHLQLPLDALNSAITADPTWILTPANEDEIATQVENRKILLGHVSGRGGNISEKTAWQVWGDAGGRCMFAGCGANLTSVPLYNGSARIGYLAHIVASSPDGPRGTPESHLLSDRPENIMLMCDAHHRTIDSFAPAEYPADILREMRQSHRDIVRNYLDSLAFPRAKAVTLHANLAGVPTHFHESELIDAILATGRAMLPGVVHYVRRTQRDDRTLPDFWPHYLETHRHDINTLVSSFTSPSASVSDELAVFPLHHSATMVLAGRIMGEARAIQVFQYHRQRRTWTWDPATTPQPPGMFVVEGLMSDQVDEAVITIELTAYLDEDAIPADLAAKIASGQMPRVRITTPNPGFDCIGHPDDLDQFMVVARRAINHVQDNMRARKIHLITMSPASTLFRFGQMLQPGHHSTYTIYDRAGRDTPFSEAFSISGHEVTASAGGRTTSIPIR